MTETKCTYTYENKNVEESHRWIVYGELMCLELRISRITDPGVSPICREWSGGLEFHYRASPPWKSFAPPSHTDCPLTGGDCWHAGTSLIVTEHWIPLCKDVDWDWRPIMGYLQQELTEREEELAEERSG